MFTGICVYHHFILFGKGVGEGLKWFDADVYYNQYLYLSKIMLLAWSMIFFLDMSYIDP